MASVDPVPRQACARGSDVGLGLSVDVLPCLRTRDDEPELLELTDELGRDRGALAQLGLVDLVLVAENADGATTRAVARGARSVQLLANNPKRKELVPLEAQDRRQPLEV